MYSSRRGSRINTDKFLNERLRCAQASSRVREHALPGNCLDFNSLNSSFLGFLVIQKDIGQFHSPPDSSIKPYVRRIISSRSIFTLWIWIKASPFNLQISTGNVFFFYFFFIKIIYLEESDRFF